MSASTINTAVSILPVNGLPMIAPGDDLAAMVSGAIRESIGRLCPGDIVVVTHKVVSKAEGRLVDLATITPSDFATRWADAWGKDARHVELVLHQAKRIVRMHNGLIVAETHHGFICANAGIDASNSGSDQAVMLPIDPDGSATHIRAHLRQAFSLEDAPLGVIVTDSFGRPWRNGIVNIAIGVAGMSPFADYRGQHDPSGYELRASVLAVADELASAAELVMHKVDQVPVAVIRNYRWSVEEGSGQDLVMPEERNLFK